MRLARERRMDAPIGSLSQEKRNLGLARRTHLACGVAQRSMQREACPLDLTRKTKLVEILRIVLGHATPQHFRLPRRCRNLEALQLAHDLQPAVRAMQLGTGCYMLPAQQKLVELLCRYGLDLAPQPAHRQAMDPR